MKISIQIEDASPEELQWLFSSPQGITFKSARVKIREEFRKLQPIPTRIEETGCAGCEETGLA